MEDKYIYAVRDSQYPNNEAIRLLGAYNTFNEVYANRTGRQWLHHFSQSEGPRPPPELPLLPVDSIGGHQTLQLSPSSVLSTCVSHSCGTVESPANRETLSRDPPIFRIRNFLSTDETSEIIAQSTAKLAASIVGSGTFNRSHRSSRNTWLSVKESYLLTDIYKRVADALHIDSGALISSAGGVSAKAENLQVVHYSSGAQYAPHYDWWVDDGPASRFITLLLYLNTVCEDCGGETYFPYANCSQSHNNTGLFISPEAGTAVVFYNLLGDGNGDIKTLHSSQPVLSGEKWLANIWIWDPVKP